MQLTSNTKINFSLPLSLATRVTTQWLKQPIFFCNVVPGQLTACICESLVPFGNRKCCHQNGNNSSPRSHVNSINLLPPPLVSMEEAPITPLLHVAPTHYPALSAVACVLKAPPLHQALQLSLAPPPQQAGTHQLY